MPRLVFSREEENRIRCDCGRSSGSSWRRGKTCVRRRSKTTDTFRRRINASDAAALAAYTLKIALKTDKKSTLFTLPAAKGTGLADGSVLELGSILCADFFDTEITFIGFVFALEEKDTANDYTVHHWTIPVALPVVEGAGKVTGRLRNLWRRLARLRTRCCGV